MAPESCTPNPPPEELALAADMAGCALIGRPLVEGTGSLANFRVQAKNLGTDLMGAYLAAAQELVQRLDTFTFPKKERPELLVLHASSHHTSNTMALWAGVRERLGEVCSVQEIGLRNGTLDDCSGCPYTMCIHFGEKGECFYGGVMSREVYPAVRRADGVVMLCPNSQRRTLRLISLPSSTASPPCSARPASMTRPCSPWWSLAIRAATWWPGS